MKISGIDKDFETIIYELDANGFQPFASCDGVLANHKNPNEVNKAYISFLKSPKIIDLMAIFLQEKDRFGVLIKSEDHVNLHELYGNIIEGTTYQVFFENKMSENTAYFENIIRDLIKQKETDSSEEKRKLEILDKTLEENSDSDIAFEIQLNTNYQPCMNKSGKINELKVTTKVGEEKTRGEILFTEQKKI